MYLHHIGQTGIYAEPSERFREGFPSGKIPLPEWIRLPAAKSSRNQFREAERNPFPSSLRKPFMRNFPGIPSSRPAPSDSHAFRSKRIPSGRKTSEKIPSICRKRQRESSSHSRGSPSRLRLPFQIYCSISSFLHTVTLSDSLTPAGAFPSLTRFRQCARETATSSRTAGNRSNPPGSGDSALAISASLRSMIASIAGRSLSATARENVADIGTEKGRKM